MAQSCDAHGVAESGEASPDDGVAGRRVVGAREVATEACQFDDVACDGGSGVAAGLGRKQFVKQVLVQFSEGFVGRGGRCSSIEHLLEYPELELSNNLAENSMRPVAIGRRNWLHLGSKEAGPKIAALFSVVESCSKLGVPIRKYLVDVLPGLADRSIQSLAELTPTAYAAKLAK